MIKNEVFWVNTNVEENGVNMLFLYTANIQRHTKGMQRAKTL